jgi:hypothetical protein
MTWPVHDYGDVQLEFKTHSFRFSQTLLCLLGCFRFVLAGKGSLRPPVPTMTGVSVAAAGIWRTDALQCRVSTARQKTGETDRTAFVVRANAKPLLCDMFGAQGPPMPPPEGSEEKAAGPSAAPSHVRDGRGRSAERQEGKSGAPGGAKDLDESSELSASDDDRPWISWFTSLRCARKAPFLLSFQRQRGFAPPPF